MELTYGSDLTTFSILLFGFVLGIKHAVEADHLAAVATIVAERKHLLSSTIVGGLWGVGHTSSLLIVGLLVIILKLKITDRIEAGLEAVVGIMLVILGLNAFRNLLRKEKIHVHSHEHDGFKHIHIHAHEDEKLEENHHFMRFSSRSVLVGFIHGVAGSAGLMLLIVPTIKSPAIALVYILIFGIGSIGGMMFMSLLVGLPVHFAAGSHRILNKTILGLAGCFSVGLGVFLVYEKLIA
jgi:high-affinity nickel permease